MCLSISWKSVEHVGYVQEFHLGSLKVIKTLEPQISGVAWDMGIFIEIWDSPTQYNREMTQIRKRVELSWFGINNFGLDDQNGDFTVEKDKFIHERRELTQKQEHEVIHKWWLCYIKILACRRMKQIDSQKLDDIPWYTHIPALKEVCIPVIRHLNPCLEHGRYYATTPTYSICESLELLIRKRITYSKYSSKDST